VFEIGSSLRDARMRQKLELSQIEHATRIRSKYLQALEDERFDLLPGTAYTKGFLRTYAEYLGLDGQRFVDEYNSRFPPTVEPPAAPLAKVRRRRTLLDSRLIVLPFAALLALIGWQLASTGKGHGHVAHAPPTPAIRASRAVPPPALPPARPRTRTARLVLAATRGRCWLLVRLGSDTSKVIYEQTLEQGRSVRFAGTRFWIRLGAPWNLDATLNGRPVQLPGSIGNVVVTPTGLAGER